MPDRPPHATTRAATPADTADLARLRWTWRIEDKRQHGEVDRPSFTASFGAWLAEHGSTHIGVVATTAPPGPPTASAAPPVIGMGWLAVVDRIPGPERFERRSGLIQSLYVEAAHRGQGIGAALIEALFDEARRRGLDYLTVHPSTAAFPLYRRCGFGDAGRALELDLVERTPPPPAI